MYRLFSTIDENPPVKKSSISSPCGQAEEEVDNTVCGSRIELASAQGPGIKNTSLLEACVSKQATNTGMISAAQSSSSLPGAFSSDVKTDQADSVVAAKNQAVSAGSSLQLAAAVEGRSTLYPSSQKGSMSADIPIVQEVDTSQVLSNKEQEKPQKITTGVKYPNAEHIIRGADVDDVENGGRIRLLEEEKSISEIDDSTEMDKSQEQEFRMSRTSSGLELPTLEAVKVEPEESNLAIMATAEKDSCWVSFKRSRCAQIATFFGCFLITALLIGLMLSLFNKAIDVQEYAEEFFDQIGSSLDGPVIRGEHGSSISISRDGTRMAVADSKDVYVYDLQQQKEETANGTFDWQLVTTIEAPEHATIGEALYRHDMVRTAVQVDLSRNGDFIAVGWPYSGNEDGLEPSIGRVEVYQDQGNGVWERIGNVMYGWSSEDFFGTSLSLSGTGGAVVVGAPGNEGHADIFLLNQGVWVKQGDFVSLEGKLAVGSVSSDETSQTFSVAGYPLSEDANAAVVRIFRFTAGNWVELGNGIIGDFQDTAYITSLSADGTIVAVSNYYRGAAGPAKGQLNDALDVRVYRWDEDSNYWVQLGENLHGSAPGEKSGYFISLSDDGTLMGMGDPGRDSSDGGGVAGHAHIYQYSEQSGVWEQRGPNKDGEAPGDQFGFAVSLSGDGTRFAVGAPFNRGEGMERGRVSVYDIDLL